VILPFVSRQCLIIKQSNPCIPIEFCFRWNITRTRRTQHTKVVGKQTHASFSSRSFNRLSGSVYPDVVVVVVVVHCERPLQHLPGAHHSKDSGNTTTTIIKRERFWRDAASSESESGEIYYGTYYYSVYVRTHTNTHTPTHTLTK